MNIKKSFIIVILLELASLGFVFGQQQEHTANYMFNTLLYNPSTSGFSDAIGATLIHRQQWYGGEGVPQTTMLTVDMPVSSINSGLGLVITNDKLGSFNNTKVNLGYNYQFSVGNGTLSVGAGLGFKSFNFNTNDIKSETPEDPVVKDKTTSSEFLFNLSGGVFYQVQDKFEVGISMEDITGSKSDYLHLKTNRALNIHGSYLFNIEAFPSIDFIPSTFISTDFLSVTADVSLIGMYNSQFWGGLSYRFADAVVLYAGLFIKQVQVGLAYDFATISMRKSSKIGGGFEVFLRYNFNLSVDRLPRSYKNSRYL